MILVGLGGNLDSVLGPPRATCTEALAQVEAAGARVLRCSPWYETAPVPVSDQPWFINAVAELADSLNPQELLGLFHSIEDKFGRVRSVANGARTLDLDLLAYHELMRGPEMAPPHLPHPRLHERAFVLLPLCDLSPEWRHPATGATAAEMAARLPSGQQIRRLP